MKFIGLTILFAVYAVECRKIYTPIDKNANVDFINMEGGGARARPAIIEPRKPAPVPAVTTKSPVPVAKPASPTATVVPTVKPLAPQPQKPVVPVPTNNQIKPVPVNPTPAVNPITTPGPGSVKSLVNFYDSQGKASIIRPYSYSQAVKQG